MLAQTNSLKTYKIVFIDNNGQEFEKEIFADKKTQARKIIREEYKIKNYQIIDVILMQDSNNLDSFKIESKKDNSVDDLSQTQGDFNNTMMQNQNIIKEETNFLESGTQEFDLESE